MKKQLVETGDANTNSEEYIKKYCEKHNISKEEAIKHLTVQNVKKYFETEE